VEDHIVSLFFFFSPETHKKSHTAVVGEESSSEYGMCIWNKELWGIPCTKAVPSRSKLNKYRIFEA